MSLNISETSLKLKLAKRETKELKQRLKIAELQLARVTIENESLSNSLQETDDLTKVLENSVESLRSQLSVVEEDRSALRCRLDKGEKDNGFLSQEFKTLVTQSTSEKAELKGLLEDSEHKNSILEQENKDLKRKLKNAKTKIHELRTVAGTVESLKSEKQRLELDNVQLMQLISTVKQYRNLYDLSSCANGLSFVPSAHYKNRVSLGNIKGEWLPTDVYKILQATKTTQKFTAFQVASLLNQLNQAWQANFIKKNKAEDLIKVICERLELFCEEAIEEGKPLRHCRDKFVKDIRKQLQAYTSKSLSS